MEDLIKKYQQALELANSALEINKKKFLQSSQSKNFRLAEIILQDRKILDFEIKLINEFLKDLEGKNA